MEFAPVGALNVCAGETHDRIWQISMCAPTFAMGGRFQRNKGVPLLTVDVDIG
jgi:hypothetical protein